MAKENSWGLHVEQFPQQELRHLPVFVKELLAGGIAGGLSKTCVAPLERVKILFQTGRMTENSISRTLWKILREEGLPGWYRGNGASVLRIVPYAAFNFGAYEQYRSLLAQYMYGSEAETHHIPPVLDLLAGSAAGGTAVLMTYPLDLVRTRLAYGNEKGNGPANRSGSLPQMPAASGSVGSSPMPSSAPPSARSSQHAALSASEHGQRGSSPGLSQTARIASSQTAGPSGRVLADAKQSCSPAGSMTLGRAPSSPHMQLQSLFSSKAAGARMERAGAIQRATIRSILLDTWRKEGATGLYRGINPTLLGIVPYAGLKFYIYQSLKQYYWQFQGPAGVQALERGGHHQRLPVWLMLSFGGLAGVVAQTITYPLDVVRRHMQVQGLRGDKFSEQKFSSTWDGLTQIARQKGLRALFAGLSINYLKVVPSTAIGFTIYDAAKHYLDLPQNL